jgi:tRNA threonylcarbamoyladenosine biosynthesis protein TsaE
MREVSLGDLEREGARLWSTLARGAVIWLSGELGAGKTALVQAITRAAAAGQARSPTFALIHEYDSPEGPLVHVDCYRLKTPGDALDLDLDAIARRARLTMIEWPERAGQFAPAPDVHVRLEYASRPDLRLIDTT